MKKVLTLVAAVAFIASLSSCKKDWTCNCTYSDSLIPSVSTPITKAKKKDAQDACDALDATAKIVNGSCELKKK